MASPLTRPIILLAMPRSGSSMTAGLFAQHGVWTGECDPPDQWNAKGYFENRRIKRLLVQEFGRVVGKGKEVEERSIRPQLEQALDADGYSGGQWLFKCSAMYWRAFVDLEPVFVTIRRRADSIMASNLDSNVLTLRDTSLRRHIEVLDESEERGALRIDSERLIARDYAQASRVFEVCGLRLDPDIADDWIEPALWRH